MERGVFRWEHGLTHQSPEATRMRTKDTKIFIKTCSENVMCEIGIEQRGGGGRWPMFGVMWGGQLFNISLLESTRSHRDRKTETLSLSYCNVKPDQIMSGAHRKSFLGGAAHISCAPNGLLPMSTMRCYLIRNQSSRPHIF